MTSYYLGSSVTQYTGTTFQENGVNFGYFDALGMLGEELGTDSPEFQQWCSACGNYLTPQVINDDEAAASGATYYPCLTAADVNYQYDYGFQTSNSTCDSLAAYLYSDYVFNLNGETQNECGPPV
jgi:hypothetical protein